MSSRPSTSAPPRVAIRSTSSARSRGEAASCGLLSSTAAALLRPYAAGPIASASRCSSSAWRASASDPRGQPHIRAGAVRHARARAPESRHLAGRRMDHVCVPDVRADPAEILGQLHRRAAEGRPAVVGLVARLGKVRVRVDAVGARQLDALAHQVGRDRERRAGRQHDPQHRVAACVVVLLDQPPRVAQDGILVLDHAVGRQAAARFADRHRAAGGVEAEAQLLRGPDLVVEARAVGPDIGVIARRGAA